MTWHIRARPLCIGLLLLSVLSSPSLAVDKPPVEPAPEILSQLDAHQQELWREYAKANAELEDFYGNIRIEATRTRVGMLIQKDGPNPEGKAIERYTYRARDSQYLRLDSETCAFDTEEPTGVCSVVLVRPEGYALAHKSGPDKPYVIARVAHDSHLGRNAIWQTHFPDAALWVGSAYSSVYMLTRPPTATTYRIAGVEELEEAGRKCVRVTIESSSATGSSHIVAVFLRDAKWAVKSFRVEGVKPNRDDYYVQFGEFNYTGNPGEFPLLKSGRYWVEAPEPEAKDWQESFRIERIEPGPVPLEEFSPTAVAAELRIADQTLVQEPTGPAFRYPAGQHGGGELKFVNDIPVLIVAGSPEEIGQQIGVLAVRHAERFLHFPDQLLKARNLQFVRPQLVQVGKTLLEHSPEPYQRELKAMAAAGNVDGDTLALINTVDDLERIGGCSSITVLGPRSAAGDPLVARNLDYTVPAFVPRYTLVTVYRPAGKLTFASVGFPGFVGVLSAMNEAGLTLVSHDINASADGSPSFSMDGTPMMLTFRRVMEECRTVDEAEQLLRSVKHTTYLSIAVCDCERAAVFELTPQTVAVRRPEDGVLISTNHFRSPELGVPQKCWRYEALSDGAAASTLDVPTLWERLSKASHDGTLQSMIFEPASLRLHLSFGVLPATAQPPKTLELADLLRPDKRP